MSSNNNSIKAIEPTNFQIQSKFATQSLVPNRHNSNLQVATQDNYQKQNSGPNSTQFKSRFMNNEFQKQNYSINQFGQQYQQESRFFNNNSIELYNKQESPQVLDMYKTKMKQPGGRKGSQVTQSAGHKQFKNQIHKSFDTSFSQPLMADKYLNIQPTASQKQHLPQSQSPTQNSKIGNSNSVLSQFQAFQQTIQQQQQSHKRNQSLGSSNTMNLPKKAVQNSFEGKKNFVQANSRTGIANEFSTINGRNGDASQTKGSRFITSNNNRLQIVENDSLNLLAEQSKQATNDFSVMNQNIKSNLIDSYVNQQQIKAKISQMNNQRPKTSFGQHNNSKIEKLNPSQIHNDSVQLDKVEDDLKNDLEQITAASKDYASNQPKSFIIKKGERNEGLRNYLRKSLDSSNTRQKSLDSQINIPQLTALISGSSDQLPQKKNNSQQPKIKKRRDFSKVVANGQQFISLQPSQQQQISTSIAITPQKTGKSNQSVKKNLYQEQFSQISDQKQALMKQMNQNVQPQFMTIQQESRLSNKKPSEKSLHQRSQTSHKINRPTPGVTMLRSSVNETISSLEDRNVTIAVNEGEDQEIIGIQKAHSEERPQSKYRSTRQNFNNMRASITQEVTTQQQQQKFDNCVSKFAFATKTGYSPSNPYKVNQDSFLAMPHLGEYRRTHFFAVADGHGVFGKEVSEFIKQTLSQKVEEEIKNIFDKAKRMQRVVDSNEVKDALALSFQFTNNSLYTDSNIDIYFSGSTCVSVLIVGNKVFCANVGDSRAVLARERNGQVEGVPLNRDHKANEPDEERRILMHGGRIEAFKDQNGRPMGPARVWHLNENIPGLAMSRSFGDHAAAEVGVIAEPEILEMNLTEEDKFIVIASDGVWEFLSNEEVSKIVYPHYLNNSAEKAAEALIRESLKRWKEEESVVDDITCIIIFLTITT